MKTQTGQVRGKTAARHTSLKFVAFLEDVAGGVEPGREVHLAWDKLLAHQTQPVDDFVGRHPQVDLRFTPADLSWLDRVELCFSKVRRDIAARGAFTSAAGLARKLRRYVNAYSKTAKPLRWKYADPSSRIRHGHDDSRTSHWPSSASLVADSFPSTR